MTVLDKLRESKHPNVYFSIKPHMPTLTCTKPKTAQEPFRVTMSSKSRPLIIAKFEEFIAQTITIKSQRLANEMKTFIWKSRAEMRGYNDDLVIAYY